VKGAVDSGLIGAGAAASVRVIRGTIKSQVPHP
jgi:hypothetical protein